jgi:hypothetical protein
MYGTRIVTVWDNFGIFAGENAYYLYNLSTNDLKRVQAVIQIQDELGQALQFGPISGRGSMIYIIRDGRYYSCDMRAFLHDQ